MHHESDGSSSDVPSLNDKKQKLRSVDAGPCCSSSANYAPWRLAALIALAPDERLTRKRDAARLIIYSSVSESGAKRSSRFVASVTLLSEEGRGDEKKEKKMHGVVINLRILAKKVANT